MGVFAGMGVGLQSQEHSVGIDISCHEHDKKLSNNKHNGNKIWQKGAFYRVGRSCNVEKGRGLQWDEALLSLLARPLDKC